MPALALNSPDPKNLPKTMPKDMTPSQAWGTIIDLSKRVAANRKEADKIATQTERVGDAIVTPVLSITAAFLTPLALEAFPKIKRIGKGKVMVDTHLVISATTLIAGIGMAWAGMDGHRLVTAVGTGTASSYAGIKAQQLGQKWFNKAA